MSALLIAAQLVGWVGLVVGFVGLVAWGSRRPRYFVPGNDDPLLDDEGMIWDYCCGEIRVELGTRCPTCLTLVE